MGRLKAIPSRLKPIGSRLKPAMTREESEIARDRERNKTQPWRKWYRTKPWDRLRDKIIARDAYTCQQTGVLCLGEHPAPNSPVVDQIKPHHGDPALFWDPENLQTVTKEYHDKHKQSAERRAGGRFADW
jgi:5-methylcytosine-specific restriction protein A